MGKTSRNPRKETKKKKDDGSKMKEEKFCSFPMKEIPPFVMFIVSKHCLCWLLLLLAAMLCVV